MAATSTLVSALPATDNFAHDPTASASSANHSGQASGTRSRRGGAARGGGNRSRGRGNGRFQNAREFTDQPPPGGATLPQPGDGAYLANVSNRPPSGNQSRRPNQPRMPQGPNDPRQRARNAHQQQAPENQPVLPVDHSRSGLAGNADGAVAGSIIQGQIHGDADRVTIGVSSGRGDRPPKTRNRNNRNNKANTSQNTAEGSNRPSIPNNEENTGSKPQPRKNGRERQQQSQQGVSKPPVNARRAAFGGKLSSYAANGKSKNHDGDAENQFEEAQDRAMLGYSSVDRRNVFGMSKEADDLTSRLIRGLTSRPFLECPICFSDLLPSQAIWSCLPTFSSTNPSTADTTCCYTPFHLSCMQDWSSRSLKEARERARDRSATDQTPITWRCPGCQKHRGSTVTNYQCFCGRIKHLKSTEDNRGSSSIAVPHSCGQSCSRKRSHCDHPCPLPCHPGPCPPCNISLVIPCASHGHPLTVKCSSVHAANASVPTCDELCERIQDCGHPEHRCQEPCHEGPCSECTVREQVLCYCGAEEKSVKCGWKKKDEVECGIRERGDERKWKARFGCAKECGRFYDCGEHQCKELCHPHSIDPLPCPRSPEFVTHCPCTQTALVDFTSKPRQKCTDPIPTCGKPCPQPQSGCDHACGRKCHEGPCPPCEVDVIAICRCGESKITMKCWEQQEMETAGELILCERICHALRSCGRHECSRICCPLAYKAKTKGKKRELTSTEEDEGGLHTCPLVCGKLLGCGIHTCPQLDHKGPCGRCLEASYDELACACGRTVMQPPIRCGTVIECTYPCNRPAPSCGHPKTPHTCHESEACPPCPYLTSKPCACGKNPAVKNVRCSQEKVSCGAVCGALLDCGYHHCEKSCHSPGECDSCHQVCRKPKKLCKHPCTAICHAPASCPEDEACTTSVIQSCPCGHLQQRATCGACTSNPVSKEQVQLKCVTECAQRQRNARLAEALGIKPMDKLVEYPVELRAFATANHHFVQGLEKTFNDFFMGPRQAMVLPHMPASKRQFAISLAEVYRFGTELVDAEPNRSVSVRRRIDSRIPNPTLSSITAPPTTAKRQLGGLGDLKRSTMAVSGTGTSHPAPPAAPTPRMWGAVNLAASAGSSSRPSPAVSPSTSRPNEPPQQQRSSSAFPSMTARYGTTTVASGVSRGARSAGASRTASPAPGPVPVVQGPLIDENARDWDASDDEA